MGLFNSIRLGSSAAGDYEVERSLRFNDDDTAYLSRTPSSAGNRKKWTFSAWIKRSNLGGSAGEQRIFGGNANASHIYFPSNDEITWDLADEGSGSASANLNTQQVFRDVGAWFHLVCALDTDESTADNRMRMYINGTEVTSFGSRTNPSSGYATNAMNNNTLHTLGYRTSGQGSAGMEFDGYMAEIHFIDGQQYNASYFAETDAVTGEYKPKKYAGSYGTTGFFLDFSDNSGTTATTLGKDSSGNSNNWTPNNFSVSAGTGNDSLTDTPTNNFCTLSPLTGNGTQFSTSSNGNLDFSCASGTGQISYGSMLIPETGKWYAEVVFSSGGQHSSYGVRNPIDGSSLVNLEFSTSQEQIRADNSYLESSTESWGNGNVLGIKVDRDAGTIQFAVDGTNASTAINLSEMDNSSQLVFSTSRTEGGGAHVAGSFNFGQRPFSHLPTDYKSLCTANLDDPTIKLPNKHFDTLLYTGNETSGHNITGLEFQPDLVWIKQRSGTRQAQITDVVRGVGKILVPSETDAEQTISGVSAFNSDGFTLGDHVGANENNDTFVAWNWKGGGTASSNSDGTITSSVSANTTAGFSVVTYTGTGSTATIGHGLGVAPKVVITKPRSSSGSWAVLHTVGDPTAENRLLLNDNGAYSSYQGYKLWNDTVPTSSVFTVREDAATNASSVTYVAYCFSEVAGYSKFGKYIGNGDNNGVFVYTGFKVKWLLIKRTSSEHWILADTARNSVSGRESPADSYLLASANNAESTGIIYDMLSNGFKFRSNSQNESGSTYIYMAFAESPFKYARAR